MSLSKFVTLPPNHGNHFDQPLTKLFGQILRVEVEKLETLKIGRNNRKTLLEGTIHYYSIHHDTKYNIESIEILSQLF